MKIDQHPRVMPYLPQTTITAEPGDTEIRIDQKIIDAGVTWGSVTIVSDVPVVLADDLSKLSFNAQGVDVSFEGDLAILSLTAKSLTGDGSIYLPFGLTTSGSVTLGGTLSSERHQETTIGGDLKCAYLDCDGHVVVAGAFDCPQWNTRSLTVAGQEIADVRISTQDMEMNND